MLTKEKSQEQTKAKIYDFYGKEHSLKIPSINFKSNQQEIFIRNQYKRNALLIKAKKKEYKKLFLKGKNKLVYDKKREIISIKNKYKNEKNVLINSLKEYQRKSTIIGIVKSEIKKINHNEKSIKNNLRKYYKFIQKSEDNLEKSRYLLDTEKINAKKELLVLLKLKNLFKIMKHLLSKNIDLQDFISIKKVLSDDENDFLNNNIKIYEKMIDKIKINLKNFSIRSKEISDNLDKKLQTIKENFHKELRNFKISNKLKIKKLEYEYNYDFSCLDQNNKKIKNNFLINLKKNKDYSRNHIWNIKKEKQQIVETQKAEIILLKRKRRILRYIYFYILQISHLSNKINFLKLDNKIFLSHINILNKRLAFYEKQDLSFFKDKKCFCKFNETKKYIHDLWINSKQLFKAKTSKLESFLYNDHFNFFGNLEYKWLNYNIAHSKYSIPIGNVWKNVSYEGDKYYKKHLMKLEHLINWKTKLHALNNNRVNNYKGLNKNSSRKIHNKKDFNEKKLKIKKFYKSKILEIKQNIKNNIDAKSALKQKRKEYKIFQKEEIREIRLLNSSYSASSNKKLFKWQYLFSKRKTYKIYSSKLTELRKTTPMETFRGLRYIAAFLNLIIPGISSLLFFKQYSKGILLLLITTLMYSLFIPFILGITSEKFGGILGLLDMGAKYHNWRLGIVPDARYYLLGGIISIFLLVALVLYNLSLSISAFKTGRNLEFGVRPLGWISTKKWMGSKGFPWMISLPAWIIILFIVVTPILTSLLISFTNMGFNHEPPGKIVDWVGLNQYGKWWLFRNSGMGKSISRVFTWTIIWTLLSSSLVIFLGTIFAVLVNQNRIKYKMFFRLIYIIPWAIPAFVTIMFLKSAFQSSDGALINMVMLKMNIISSPVDWFGSIWLIRIILILIQGWLGHSYIFLLVTGNMQSISKDVYEAGKIDGASNNKLFFKITLPILLQSIGPLLISQFTFNFNNFTIISLFSGGGPAFIDPTPFLEGGSDIIISWVYKLTTNVAQIDGNMAFSSAMTILASLISVGVASYGFAKSSAFRG